MLVYGISGSSTYSVSLSNIDEVMSILPDNLSNQISARNLRDVVLTLYDSIILGINSSSSLSASNVYWTNVNPTLNDVGGVNSNTTFNVGTTTLQDIFNNMLYPYTAPIVTFNVTTDLTGSVLNNILEYGNTQSVRLSYSITKKSNIISSVNLIGSNTIYYHTGTFNIFAIPPPYPTNTNSVITDWYSTKPTLNTNMTFTMSVNDGSNHSTTSSIIWQNKRYWGSVDLSSIGNPDLTLNPGSYSSVSTYLSSLIGGCSAVILGLTGAGYGSGSELSDTRIMIKKLIGYDKYFVFAWPTSFGIPIFSNTVFTTNSFTRILSTYSFVNQYGYTSSYDMWISNTLIGGDSINLIQIA